MPEQETLKVAVLGGGDIARKGYFPLLKGWPGIELSGLFSRTEQTVAEVRARWDFPAGTTDLEEVLGWAPDAAFVLTSTDSHAALMRALLEADVDVFVEKPATTSAGLTQELADLARARGRILMVGFNRRYALLFRQARELFGDRPIRQCIMQKHRPGMKPRDLFHTYLDDTIHQIDLLRFFCGDVQPLTTRYQMDGGRLVSAASVTAIAGQGLGLVLMSREAGMWQERVTLHGDNLTVEVDAFREMRVRKGGAVTSYGADRAGRWLPQLEERGFKGEIAHFFDCVRTRQTPESDGFEAARSQELMEALVEVAEEVV